MPSARIGVVPLGFAHRGGAVYVPLQRKIDPSTRGNHFLTTYARLKPRVTIERATSEMHTLGESLAREFNHNHGISTSARFTRRSSAVSGRRSHPARRGVLVLLIACANVANLLLASGLSRRRELAIRLALGAGQRDLARQLTIEAVLLALVGGGVGVLLACWIVRTFLGLATTVLPRVGQITIDGRVLVSMRADPLAALRQQ